MLKNQRVEQADFVGTCDECKRSSVELRRVAIMDAFHRGPRGYASLCFSCCSRRIFWTREDGRQMETPSYGNDAETEKIIKESDGG